METLEKCAWIDCGYGCRKGRGSKAIYNGEDTAGEVSSKVSQLVSNEVLNEDENHMS